MTLHLPKYVSECLDTLNSNGFEAWCVGGAVRDLIMGKIPYDYDITTDAEPEQIISLFSKTVPTGIAHGTVTVVTDSGNIEVTTYRTDGNYSDHRAPDNVTYIKSLDEDLKRRDFTVNAVCYNPSRGFYDPQNGCADIKANILRAIGDPDKRFNEDALRIMRLFRFSAQLGFKIDRATLDSSLNQAKLLQNISVERIYSELCKTLTAAEPKRLSPLLKHGAFLFCGIPSLEVPDTIMCLPEKFALRFALLCCNGSVNETEILRKLKADNETVRKAEIYRKLLNAPAPESKSDIKWLLKLSSPDMIVDVMRFYEVKGASVESIKKKLTDILENNEPYCVKMLEIGGNDLKEAGITGPEIGRCLEKLTEHVIDRPEDNNKETLKKLIKLII